VGQTGRAGGEGVMEKIHHLPSVGRFRVVDGCDGMSREKEEKGGNHRDEPQL